MFSFAKKKTTEVTGKVYDITLYFVGNNPAFVVIVNLNLVEKLIKSYKLKANLKNSRKIQ